MAKVMVIGGAGYIGSQTCKELKKAGHDVLVFDNLSTGFKQLLKYGEFIEGDILEPAQINAALQKFSPDAIMHFAAKALVGESVTNPELYYRNNVTGSLNVLEAMLKLKKAPAFIFSSTCSVYGITDQPISEIDSIQPINPYAKTKRMVEEILEDFDRAHKIRYTSLRYFNAAGSDPDGEVGELHEPETHLLPRLLLHAKNPSQHEITIFGEDYPTEDGTCVRDYIHVQDLAHAHILAMNRLLEGGSSDIYNLGTTNGTSVKEAMKMVEKVTGKKLKPQFGDRRPGDPPRLVAGSKKAKNILQWMPKHNLESIVKTAWSWILEHRS
jgi:UDP-glucose-4-epimerase GalE